jgi:hypothetical protein
MKNDLVVADSAAADGRTPRGNRDIEPFDILDRAAAVANEMMMRMKIGVVTRSFSFSGNLADQARASQIAQAVINRCAGNTRIAPVQRLENFIGGGVDGLAHQEFENVVALRRAPQVGALEAGVEIDGGRRHRFRLNLKLDFVKI